MRTRTMAAVGVGALLLATGVGAMITAREDGGETVGAAEEKAATTVSGALAQRTDCGVVATNETGFYPATTPYPVRADAGNKQVLKGAAVGAIAGEVIGDKPGYGAAAGGQAVKADKQNDADAAFDAEVAAYTRQKAAYDAALQNCLR